MRRLPSCALALVAALGSSARAQQSASTPTTTRNGITLADVVGKWQAKNMVGPNDSVVTTYVIVVPPNDTLWTVKYPDREGIPVRVVAVAGDSIVTEAGPYVSQLRPGVMVTVHSVSHYNGNEMTGRFQAAYATGDTVRGKVAATRIP